jgi:autotransporter-associated beta strand protein
LDVVSAGDLYLANDTSSDATYTGSWTYQRNRNTTEFCRDVHETTVNGDYVEFAFSGTDIQLLGTGDSSHGTVDIYLDGVFQQTVSAQTASPQYRKVIFSKSGLARGNHKLKAVKTGGTYFTVDGFRASELIDSAQPDVSYQVLTFFNNTATAYDPVGYIEYGGGYWFWQARDRNEYNWDCQVTAQNGAYFNIHFNGTGVQFVGTRDGVIDFYLDGTFVTEVNMGSFGSLARNVGLDLRGLPPGNHTLTGVKVGDTYLLVDAVFVYNSQNSSWNNQADSTSISNSYQRSYAYSDVATVPFQGTGIEVIAPHSTAGGTVAVSISAAAQNLQGAGYQGFAGEDVSQYAGATAPQTVSFASRNVTTLAPGNYLLSMSHNRSFGSIALDAFRVYKNQPGSGPALFWGATGGGSNGTWDANNTANWWDGSSTTPWYDAGGVDYSAVFQGAAGTVSLASGVNANQLTFNSTGYLLQSNTITLNGNSPNITVATNVTATINSTVAGSAGFTKSGPGKLILATSSTLTGAATITNGTLTLQDTYAASGFTIASNAVLELNTGTTDKNYGTAVFSGTGTLRKTGTSSAVWGATVANFALGSGALIDVQGGIFTGGSWANDVWVNNLSSLNVASGAEFDGVEANVQVNALTGGGKITSGYAGSGYANFTFGVDNGSGTFSGVLADGNAAGNYVKAGTGTQILSGTNTYTGTTTVSSGVLLVNGSIGGGAVTASAGATLGGTGIIKGPVTVQSGATLAPGASLGTLTISNTLTLAAGSTTFMELNAASGTNDLVRGITTVNYGGTLVVTNLAGSVSAGQTFKLFNAASRTGNFSAVTGVPGVTWNFNPTNGVLTALNTAALNSTNLVASVSSTNLTLSWPADHTGWTLMQQTNHLNLGISMNTNDWMRLPGSSTTNSVAIPILPNMPGGYYRLVYP